MAAHAVKFDYVESKCRLKYSTFSNIIWWIRLSIIVFWQCC